MTDTAAAQPVLSEKKKPDFCLPKPLSLPQESVNLVISRFACGYWRDLKSVACKYRLFQPITEEFYNLPCNNSDTTTQRRL